VFIACAVIPNFWPGWAASSATLTTFLIGGGNVTLIAIAMLVVMGVALTASPVVYRTMEKVEFAKVAVVLVFLVVALVAGISGSAYEDVPKAATDAGWPSGIDVAVILGALAFAGVGGVNNLCQSNWIRDKGFGMGSHIPHVVSPLTGEDQAKPSTGYMVKQDDENLERFWGWWKVAKKEQFYFFFVTGLITIMVFSLLAYSTVFGQDLGEQLDFVEGEGNALKDAVAPWFGTVFWGIGAVSLFAGSLGILDYVARVSADVIKTLYARESQRITESWVYFGFVWGEIALGTIVLLQRLRPAAGAAHRRVVAQRRRDVHLLAAAHQAQPPGPAGAYPRARAAALPAVGHRSRVRRAVGGAPPGADLSAATAARPVSTPM
jgi:hypothetical protein